MRQRKSEELSLVEDIMSGKFSFPSAKEAMRQRKSEKKRKRAFIDTFVVDDRPTAKSSATLGSVEPSLAKSSRNTKPDEFEGVMFVTLPLDGSMYSNPSFIKGVANDLLLLTDRRRFADIGQV